MGIARKSAALVLAALIPLSAAATAHAGGSSSQTRIDSYTSIQSNIWYSNTLSIRGCSDYQVSARYVGGPYKAPRPGTDWIKTHVKAQGYGVSWNGGPLLTGSMDKSVTNDRGQTSASLSGSTCFGPTTVYASWVNEASTRYYGVFRTASAS